MLVWKSHWGLLARRPPGGTAQGRPEVSGVTWGTFGPLTELALPVEVPLGGSLQGNSPLGTGPSVWQDILAVPRAPRAPTRPGGWGVLPQTVPRIRGGGFRPDPDSPNPA